MVQEKAKRIDPIRHIMNARNKLITAVLYLKEFSDDPQLIDFIWEIEDAIESLNMI